MDPRVRKATHYVLISLLVLLSTLLNLRLMPMGNHYDLFLIQSWGNRALSKGLPSLYEDKLKKDCDRNTTNHPPLHPYFFRFSAWLNQSLFGESKPLSAHYLVISKIIPFLANTAIGLLIFFYCRCRNGFKTALAAAAAYLLNPALIYIVSFWGQADSIGSLLMLASVFLLLKDQPLFSSICFSLGALIQLRVTIILPLLFWIIAKKYDLKKILLILLVNAALVFAVCLPYLAEGQVRQLLKVATDTTRMFPYLSNNTYNLWYLVSSFFSADGALKILDTIRFSGVSLRTVGWLLFGFYTMLILCRQNKDLDIPLAAAAICFAFYMLTTRIHSRYLFPFLVFLPLSFGLVRRYWIVYGLLSLNCLLNLMMILPFTDRRFPLYYWIQVVLTGMVARFSMTGVAIAISAFNLIIFIFFSWTVLTGKAFKTP